MELSVRVLCRVFEFSKLRPRLTFSTGLTAGRDAMTVELYVPYQPCNVDQEMYSTFMCLCCSSSLVNNLFG